MRQNHRAPSSTVRPGIIKGLIDETNGTTPIHRKERAIGFVFFLLPFSTFIFILMTTITLAIIGDNRYLGFAFIFLPLVSIGQVGTYIIYRAYIAEGTIKIDRNGIEVIQRRPHKPWLKDITNISIKDIIKIDINPQKNRRFVKFYLKNEFNDKNEFLFAKSRIPHFQKFIKFWAELNLAIIPSRIHALSDNEIVVNDVYEKALKEQKKSCVVGFLVFTIFSLIFSLPVIDNRWFMLFVTTTLIVVGAVFFHSILRSFLKSTPKEFIFSPYHLTIIFLEKTINLNWNNVESINPDTPLRIHLKDGNMITLDNVPSPISLKLSQHLFNSIVV